MFHRRPEIEMRQAPEIAAELRPDGLVQMIRPVEIGEHRFGDLAVAGDGPPGATRMTKNEIVMSANRVGIAPKIRRMEKAACCSSGRGPAGRPARLLGSVYFSTIISLVGWTSSRLSSQPFTYGFTRWREVVTLSGVSR